MSNSLRVIGLVVLLAGMVLVASVVWTPYGIGVLVTGVVVLLVDRALRKRELTKPGAPRFVAVHPGGKPPAPRRTKRPPQRAPAPAKAAAKRKAPARQRDREPVLDSRFEPIFEGEESAALFSDLRTEISAAAKDSLTTLRNEGFVIRARADRVSVSRNNHTEVLRSNAAIVDYLRQLGLSGE
nr:hypothetical protein WG33_0244 [uncultured bacterium]